MISDISKYKNYIETYKPIITVFVVTYNRQEYLKLTLQSILEQTYKDFCLVVLDNASTDYTEEIVTSFNDKRIVYLKHQTNVGGVRNMNTAIKIALSPYFIIFHDDDLMTPQFIEKELELIRINDCDILSSFAKHIDGDGNIINYYRNTAQKVILYSGTEYFKSFISVSRNVIYCPSVIYKRNFIQKHKLFFNEKKSGPACDTYLFFEIERNGGKIGILPQELFLYRLHNKKENNNLNAHNLIKLINSLINDSYYSNLLNIYKDNIFKLMLTIIIESLLTYKSNHDKQDLLNINEKLKQINHNFLKDKRLSLSLKLILINPLFASNIIYYLKKYYQIYKKYKYHNNNIMA